MRSKKKVEMRFENGRNEGVLHEWENGKNDDVIEKWEVVVYGFGIRRIQLSVQYNVFSQQINTAYLLQLNIAYRSSKTEAEFSCLNQDKLRVVIFSISLVGDAWRWFDGIKGSITSWVDLTGIFFRKYYPPSCTGGINNPIIKWDPTNPNFKNCYASKFVNYKTMDIFIKGALWDYWKLRSGEIKSTNDETSDLEETDHDDEQEIGEIFRIETNLFDYETPLEDGELKKEALRKKAIMEGTINDDDESIDELPICNIRRFKMIKYSFGDAEEYVAIKEDEYDDLMNTSKDACRAYQEIFRMMDEGWMVTRDE
ncbi:hypothetical protein Tco_1174666 [Tanacetum coccineum]